MSDLSPELQQLFRVTGHASRPTDADRERVFNGLQARLGIAATIDAGTMGTTVARNTARQLALKTATIAVATFAIVAGGVVSVHSLTRRPLEVVSSPNDSVVVNLVQPMPRGAETSTPDAQIPPLQEATPAVIEDHSKSTPSPTVSRRTTRTHDNLAEEAAILSRAQSELHSGRAARALSVLAEHEHKFKRGILAQERTAVRIQALCALGRVSEANALMGGLSPQSLTGDSARQACATNNKVAPR